MDKPRVYFVVQPTVAHYREPLLRELMRSKRILFDLVGRFKNTEGAEADCIQPASDDVLAQVTPMSFRTAGPLWWEDGQVRDVWNGGHDAYVLAGRIYTVSAWAALAAGRLRGRKIIFWGHGWKRPEDGFKRRLRLAFYALADGLLVYGDRAKELGVSYGVPAEKIKVVYNSIYPEALTARAADDRQDTPDAGDGRPTIIYSSRLTARHRLDTLAEALEGFASPSGAPRVIVVGDGAERPRLEEKFSRLGLEAEFLGAVYDYEQLRALYARADLAVSIGGAGLNVTQALSFGVPVLAEDGNPDSSPEIEAVVEGRTGRYYTTGSPESLRTVLDELLRDREQLRRMGEQGLAVVRERYTAERHAAALEQALLELLGR